MSSKFRLFLAGLTAAALIGGVMAADPADAGKKKKKRAKAKSSKVVQASKGGKAKAGHGGHGGKGGKSGNVYNTGNVGGGNGGGGVVPGGPAGECILDAFRDARDNGDPPGDPEGIVTAGAEMTTFLADAGDCPGTIPEGLLGCLNAQLADGAGLNQGEVIGCLRDFPPAGGGDPGPAPAPTGTVFSGDGGNGASGGTGGNATGGAAGNNTNSSSTTVNSDNHSIDVD